MRRRAFAPAPASGRQAAPTARRSRRAPTGGNRSPPGRCGCARCAGACRPRRCARSAAPRCSCGCLPAPTSNGEAAGSRFRARSPLDPRGWHAHLRRRAARSSPASPHGRREPRMSCRHSLRSKPMEALISCMITDGPAAKRPPHCMLAGGCAFAEADPWRSAAGRIGHGKGSSMMMIYRRVVLAAAGGTLAVSAMPRKPRAAETWRRWPRRCEPVSPPVSRAGRRVRRRRTGPAHHLGGIPRPRHGDQPVGHLVRALRRRDALAGGAVEGAGAEGHRRAAAVVGSRRRGRGAGVVQGTWHHGAARPAGPERRDWRGPSTPVVSRPASSSTPVARWLPG